MISKELVEDLTMAYIHSYNMAMQVVRNPEFATNIALNTVMIISATKQKQKTVDPLEILANIAKKAEEQREENNDRPENAAD